MTSHLATRRTCVRYADASSRVVTPNAPEWFHESLARNSTAGAVEVRGTPIRFQTWGKPEGRATILVHGGAAHAMWWAPLAAQLDPQSYVVAMDLSGHGTSGRRPRYSVDVWAEEIAAVARTTSEGPATVIGHSLGGIVLSYAAVEYGDRLARVVLLDSPVWGQAPAPEGALANVTTRVPPSYPDASTAMRRFRLIPPQQCANDWYLDHIAWHSLIETGTGWRWRFDPQIFANPTGDHRIARFEGSLEESLCPWAVMMGERSYLAADARHRFTSHPQAPLRLIEGAAHHVMLDQPRSLLTELQDLLATWP